MIKRITMILAAMTLIAIPVFSQETQTTDEAADDAIPFDVDLSQSATQSAESGTKSTVAQGLYIETTSDNTSLVRDIATGEKSGYEFDKADFSSYANWWLWGDITPNFHIDAEIAVWNFDKVLYKANSYGANVPDVTWGDGVQSLAEMLFSPLYYGSDGGVGTFNKFGFGIITPFANVKIGYGKVKANGMSEFTGIYTILNRVDDVGHGFLEVTNGDRIKKFGNFEVNALGALSLTCGTYGMYDILDVKYNDIVDGAITFGSSTTATELFRYNEQNENAVSAFVSISPMSMLKIELHGLTYYGTSQEMGLNSSAAATRVTFSTGSITAKLMESVAGEKVSSVWGRDSTLYADSATTRADFWWNVNSLVGFGFDEQFALKDADSYIDGLWTLRNEPMVDLNFAGLTGKEISTSLYGVYTVDRIALATNADRPWVPYLEEAGIEVVAADVAPFLKKVTADYAAYITYNDWSETNGKTYRMFYNSIMITADINESLSVHTGSIIRVQNGSDATVVPFALALGASVKTGLPGKPKFWTHFTYGMNPYEWYNYSLFRYDDPSNHITHRSYRLNCTDSSKENTTSHVSFGLIWDL